MRKILHLLFTVLVIATSASASYAGFPSKPIQIINPFAPGGETDMLLRIIANAAPPHFGQSVVIVNKTGGGGSVGMQYGARSKPDGYTIVSGSLATLLLHPLMEKMPFSYRDFDVIGQYGISQIGLFSKADAPWNDFKEFIKYSKEHPGEIKYGTAGAGTIGHLLMESICIREGGLKMVHIPFAGTAPALTSLAGGHIHVSIGDVPPAMPLIEAKKIFPLVITNTQRVKTLAKIPALPELGHKGVDVWKALLVPKGVPQHVIRYLERALEATLKDRNCIDAMAKIGQEPDFMPAEKFVPKMLEDHKWLQEIVNKLGLSKK